MSGKGQQIKVNSFAKHIIYLQHNWHTYSKNIIIKQAAIAVAASSPSFITVITNAAGEVKTAFPGRYEL